MTKNNNNVKILLLVSAALCWVPSEASKWGVTSFLSSSPIHSSQVFTKIRGGGSSGKSLTTTATSTASRLLAYNATEVEAGSTRLADLWSQLESGPDGLQQEEANARLQQFGPNALDSPPSKSVWKLIAEQFEDRLVQILLGVAVLSGVFSFLEVHNSGETQQAIWKSFVEPFVILAILVLNATVGVVQSQSAQGSLDALQKMQPSLATVLRDGQWKSGVDAADLVPGDVMEIRVGDKVPADARLVQLQSSGMQLDEGSLTGESVTVAKLPGDEGTSASADLPLQDQRGMLYSGTMVTSGSGKAVVVQTGMSTQMGKVSIFSSSSSLGDDDDLPSFDVDLCAYDIYAGLI